MIRVLPLLLAVLLIAGCGGDSKETSSSKSTSTGAGGISTDLKTEPKIPKPSGKVPATLVKRDVVKGKGEEAKPGDTISVQYTGVAFSTGEKFDASWDRGQPFEFRLGTGGVIQGWDQGVPGMRVGGRRELRIPARLAYGEQGQPPSIGPYESLIFVVDLVGVS